MQLHLTNQFKRTIQDDPTKCVLFVGAGLSTFGVLKDGKGLPNWDILMQHMIDDLCDSGKCDESTVQKLIELLREGKHLEIARIFKQRTRPDQFVLFLKDELDPPGIGLSKIHELILKTEFQGIITTNFDRVFESQNYILEPLVYPQFLEVPWTIRGRFFLKIHGCIRYTPNPFDNLILSEESYSYLRKNHKYQQILYSLFLSHPILTVGFSLRDPDFLGLVDDFKEIFQETSPTIYALMVDTGTEARDKWREKGVEIIPYANHNELVDFFEEMLLLTEQKHPVSPIAPVSKIVDINYDALLDMWDRTQAVDEKHKIIQIQMDSLLENEQKESFLFQFLNLVDENDQIHLLQHLLLLKTTACKRILVSICRKVGYWPALQPTTNNLIVYNWVLANWSSYDQNYSEDLLKWLLDKQWVDHGIDLWSSFLSILNHINSSNSRLGFEKLYDICLTIEGAREKIEKIVFAEGFVRDDDPDYRWFKDWDLDIQDNIRFEKFKNLIQSDKIPDYKNLLILARKDGYTSYVIKRILNQFTHYTHLTLHSGSDLYDPEKAREILNLLAGIKKKEEQLEVFWAINRWPDEHRGFLSLSEDANLLSEELFVPLWWRYLSETRVEYFQSRKCGKNCEILLKTGQEFLLEDMMGLTYDINKDFRVVFNTSINDHIDPTRFSKYEPRPLQEIWRDRDLNYIFSNKAPQELIRRIAIKINDWKSSDSQLGHDRWQQAQESAMQYMDNRSLSDFVSKEKKNYSIDNLLGAYFPEKVEIVLYSHMIEYAARDLGINKNDLSTVVYIHETVHAYSHIGKDCDGRLWSDYSLPQSNQPDFYPSKIHEAIAQFYTYKLLEILNDKKLMQTFLTLEQHSLEVYRAWRSTENYSLEEMRKVLIDLRIKGTEWPPSF